MDMELVCDGRLASTRTTTKNLSIVLHHQLLGCMHDVTVHHAPFRSMQINCSNYPLRTLNTDYDMPTKHVYEKESPMIHVNQQHL